LSSENRTPQYAGAATDTAPVRGYSATKDQPRRRLRRIEGQMRGMQKAAGPLRPGAQNAHLGERQLNGT